MKQNEKQVQEAVCSAQQQVSSSVKESHVKSSYFEQYSQKMSKYDVFSDQAFNHLLLRLQQENSVKFTEQFTSKLQLGIVDESTNKEVIVINAQWGHFSIDVKILNIQGSNQHHVKELQRGMYGSIYNRKLNGQKFVMKCQLARSKNSRFRAIRQWLLMKLASVARVGPKVQSYIGFDILMFSQCVEFAMEECQQISVHNSKINQFYENLAVLHKLQIVHQDIKPENIMYSPSFDKTVFIDFGLSSIISQNIGYKTLSSYVGTMNFWSPEMEQCYISKKQTFIDLYYNDLFGLEKILELLKQTKKYVSQEHYIDIPEVEKDGNSVYLSLFLGKYLIYNFQFQKFIEFYKNILRQCSSSLINFYEAQILTFFEQLSPTKDVRSFFKSYVTDKHKDTPIYSKLNILYQISQKNMCSLDIFINEEKYEYFSKMCTEIELSQKKLNENIASYMVNQKYIKQIPFLKYLSMYLDYTSYICDKHQVTPEKRHQAAAVYHKLFIKGDISTKSSRQVVAETIIYAQQWLTNRKSISIEQKTDLPYLLFKIYDFLLILDFGTSEQYISRLDNIYEHPSMSLIYKKIFLHRVLQMNYLNVIRLIPKIDVSRSVFIEKINQWIDKKKKQRKQQAIYENRIQFTQHDIQQLRYQFQKDYGLQTLQQSSFLMKMTQLDQNQINLFEIYYTILQKNKKQKIVSILAILYINNPLHKDNNHFITQIYKIFKLSLRDESILSQFCFHLQSTLIFGQLAYNNGQQIKVDLLHKINEQFKKVVTEDLCFFQHSILLVWNRTQNMRFQHSLDFLYEKEGILRRFFESYKGNLIFQLQKDRHHCYDTINLYSVLFYSSRFSEQIQKQTRAELKQNSIQIRKKCQQCQFLRDLVFEIDEAHQFLLQYGHSKTPEEEQKSISNFICVYNKINQSLFNQSINSYMIILIQKALLYGLIMCSSSPQLQRKYMGIQNYISFLYKYQMLNYLFLDTIHDFKLRNCLWVKKEKSISQLALLLFQFAQMFSEYQNMIWYDKLLKELKPIFSSQEQSQLYNLFCLLRQKQKQAKKEKQDYVYVILIYICLLDCSRNQKHLTSLFKAILENISDVRFNFRRKIAVVIYGKLFLEKFKAKRHQLYLKNRLIRLLMIDGQTVPCKESRQKKNIKQRHFQIKLNKFEMANHNRTLKITRKQTKW